MAKVVRTVRKFFVSGFVIFTFVAYVLHERVVHSAGATSVLPGTQTAVALMVPTPTQLVPATPVPVPTPTETLVPTVPELAPTTAVPAPTNAPVPTTPLPVPTGTPMPTNIPTPTIAPRLASAQYKDGSYTGTVADAYWGSLQVKAVIKQGKIADVQFLDYPHDRRTSQRINSQAMPYLQEEAVQAQSASVDIVSGATLTSQAFIESLQAALGTAKA